MKEKWKCIAGFPGYQVSNTGKIRTKRKGGFGKNTFKSKYKEMSPNINHKGYAQINLRKDGKYHRKMIHRLVLLTFGEKMDDITTLEVDHLDGNKKNNNIDNLEWVTSKENTRRAIKSGKCDNNHRFTKEEIAMGAAARRKKIIAINLETGQREEFVSLTEAAKKLYLKIRNISDVLRGRQRITGGYTFIYSDGGNKR